MARATRIALDLALVSLKKIQPAVSRLWGVTKAAVVKTPAKPLVCNVVVNKVETVLDRIAGIIVSGITSLRNKQLPREEKYLERELDKVRQRMSSSGDQGHRSTSKTLRPAIGTAWQYVKVEAAPPMTLGFFTGAGGKKIENSVAEKVDGFISGLQQRIKDLDEEETRAQKAKEAAIIAAQEKAKAVAKAKAEEKEKAEEKQRKEAEKAAKAKAETKAKEEAKKEPPKAEKKPPPKKDTPKKKDHPKPKDPPKK